jgi:tyrosyl-tRNA synthetase
LFRRGEIPDDVPESAATVEEDGTVFLPGLLTDAGLVSSRSEARRMLEQGAVKIAGEKVSEESLPATAVIGQVVQVGKRRFVRVVD